ncbi:Gfo/Idh/MocA family oxidoreductase [Kineococcus glutinatus]|uniref:Gfo/Idh/MocA family oxidoreductase n=1 Tax=Kineococcus glutinatus TaxID=1070872 RepID=UPI0031E8E5B7
MPTTSGETPPQPGAGPVRLALVGSGYRAGMVLRLARRLPHLLSVTCVLVRREAAATEVRERWGLPAARDVAGLLARGRPELAVVAAAAPDVLADLVGRGVHVLQETPPAPDLPALRRTWERVGPSGLVHVAEQYPRNPVNAARRSVVRGGAIGTPTSAQVSSTQLHHAVALLRDLLDVGFAPAEVRATTTRAPLLDPLGRAGWTGERAPRELATTIATLDFGDGRTALYDFTETQTRNPLRSRRTVVRGSHGELVDDRLVRWVDPRTVVEQQLVRRQPGTHQDVQGMYLDHISLDGRVVYRNDLAPHRLTDEEIAVTTLLREAGTWARGLGPGPYPLAEGAQDQLLGLAIEEAAATGRPVRTGAEAWAPTG